MNSIVLEGKIDNVDIGNGEEISPYILYFVNGSSYCTTIYNPDRYYEFLFQRVRVVGKLMGDQIFIEYIEKLGK